MFNKPRGTYGIGPVRRKMLPLVRQLNRLLVELEFRSRRTRLIGRPYHLFVDPVNSCNLRCPLCPTGLNLKGREKGKMSPQVFDRVLRELGPYAFQILLYNWGEPLLHENIFDYVKSADNLGIETWLSSNLNILSDEAARAVVSSGLRHLILSLDGTNPESYAEYRIGGDFHRVVENAKRLHRVKQKMESPLPHVTLQFLVFQHNAGDVPRVRALASEIGADDVSIQSGYLGGKGQTPFIGSSDTRALIEKWLVKDPAFQGDFDYFRSDGVLNPNPCHFLWRTATINWDGSLSPCCCVYETSTDFGNIMEEPFATLWNNKLFRSARAHFRSGQDVEAPKNICHKCRVFAAPLRSK